jgi:hypothetical protein
MVLCACVVCLRAARCALGRKGRCANWHKRLRRRPKATKFCSNKAIKLAKGRKMYWLYFTVNAFGFIEAYNWQFELCDHLTSDEFKEKYGGQEGLVDITFDYQVPLCYTLELRRCAGLEIVALEQVGG